jgi:PAS domain S-box-containing protein
MVIDVADNGGLTYALFNHMAEEFFGLSPAAFLGKKINPYQGKDDARRARRLRTIEAYQACVDTKTVATLEVQHIRSDGEVRWGRHTMAPAIGDGGSVSHIIVTSIDVTEIRKSQQLLEDALTTSLSGFVPICAACKNIKSDDNWIPIDTYAAEKFNYLGFSHGLCPTCVTSYVD